MTVVVAVDCGGLTATLGFGRPDFLLAAPATEDASPETDFRISDLLLDCFFLEDAELQVVVVDEFSEDRDEDSWSILGFNCVK